MTYNHAQYYYLPADHWKPSPLFKSSFFALVPITAPGDQSPPWTPSHTDEPSRREKRSGNANSVNAPGARPRLTALLINFQCARGAPYIYTLSRRASGKSRCAARHSRNFADLIGRLDSPLAARAARLLIIGSAAPRNAHWFTPMATRRALGKLLRAISRLRWRGLSPLRFQERGRGGGMLRCCYLSAWF